MTTLIEAPTRSGSRVIAALAGAVLVYSLMQTMLVPALPVLGEHFDTSVAGDRLDPDGVPVGGRGDGSG